MKKQIFVLLCLTITSMTYAQHKINWMSLNEALEAQKKEPKKIMMDVYTEWCGPCKMLDQITFQNDDVANYVNKNYYPVKFNAEGNEKVNYQGMVYENPRYDPNARGRNSVHQFAQYLTVNSYPTVVFMDDTGNPLLPLSGLRYPRDFEFYLKVIATNKYEEFSSQGKFDAYQKEFQPKFNN